MRSLAARLILGTLVLASIAAAAFFVTRSEQDISTSRYRERVFENRARDVLVGLSDLRVNQSAYVATGQDPAVWAPRSAAATSSVSTALAQLRSTATTDAVRAALDAAAARVADFASIDRRAREYLEAYMPLMASDLILADGEEAAAAVVGHIEDARAAWQQDAERTEARLKKQEALALGAAAAIALLALVLLTWPTGTTHATVGETPASGEPEPPSEGLRLRLATESLSLHESARSTVASLRELSRLCTDFGRVHDVDELRALVGQAAGLMDATGLMIWLGSSDGSELRPALAHGYTQETLARMPTLRRSTDNAVAAAYRTGQLQIVLAHERSRSGAIVAPMWTPQGCIGAISAETERGAETSESLQAMTAILAAQLAGTLQQATDVHEQRATGTS